MRIDFFRNKAGVWERTFQVLLVDPNNTYITVDAPLLEHINKQFVERRNQAQALGRSRGGRSTKIYLGAYTRGQPMHFSLTGDQAGDAPQAIPLLTSIKVQSDRILDFIQQQGSIEWSNG